jgi:putative ABC transport system permease protein
MSWLGFLLRNLWRRPGRSLFTLLAVALAIASFHVLAGLSRGMDRAAHDSLAERGIDLVVMKRGAVEFFASTLPQALAADIGRIPGVADVSAELGAVAPVGEEAHAIVGCWETDGFQWRTVPLTRGRLPASGEGGVVLGEGLAEATHIDVGGTVTLNFSDFHVTGIAAFSSALNRGMALMPLSDLQALMFREGQVSLFNVRLAAPGDPAAREAARDAIMALRPDLTVATTNEVLRGNRLVAILLASSDVIAGAALVIACLFVLNTLAMAVEERTRDIGILAAIGWSRRRIVALILSEGMLLAGLGGLLGTGLGRLGSNSLNLFVFLGGGPSTQATATFALAALVAALAVGALGAFWPAWRAARLNPATALRRQ